MYEPSGPVVVVPEETTERNSTSVAIRQVTCTGVPTPDPGVADAVGRGVHAVLLEALEAGEAAGGHVLRVGGDGGDGAALDGELEAAEGLADAAEGGVGLAHAGGEDPSVWGGGPAPGVGKISLRSIARKVREMGRKATAPARGARDDPNRWARPPAAPARIR